MNVSTYISHFLAERESTHVFGMSGANIEDLYQSIEQLKKTKIILAKNEYNAATMAIGSYISTKKISVVLTTSGPGVLNTLPVLAEAFTCSIPLVLISGLIPSQFEGLGGFQDTSGKNGTFDILEITKHCSMFQTKIQDANEIPNALELAFESSLKNKRPSIIYIPKEIFKKEITNTKVTIATSHEDQKNITEINTAIGFCKELNDEKMNPPLIVLGEELIHLKNNAQVLNLIKKSGAGVAICPNAKGLYDHQDPQFLGMIGIMGHDEVNNYLDNTKHVILIGSNFDMLNRFGLENLLESKNILIIKENKTSSLFIPKTLSNCELYGSLEGNLEALTGALVAKKSIIIKKELKELNTSYSVKNIISEIQKIISPESNVFIDAGNTGAFVVHNLELSGQGSCYISLGMGGMGNSIGAGIGSAASSQKTSHILLGDGSFLMFGLEIHTAIEYNLPVKFYIFNNNSHGMCSTRENIFQEGETGVNNFKKAYFGKGFNKIFPSLIAHEVNNIFELQTALSDTQNNHLPTLISINIDNEEIPPFRSFKK